MRMYYRRLSGFLASARWMVRGSFSLASGGAINTSHDLNCIALMILLLRGDPDDLGLFCTLHSREHADTSRRSAAVQNSHVARSMRACFHEWYTCHQYVRVPVQLLPALSGNGGIMNWTDTIPPRRSLHNYIVKSTVVNLLVISSVLYPSTLLWALW